MGGCDSCMSLIKNMLLIKKNIFWFLNGVSIYLALTQCELRQKGDPGWHQGCEWTSDPEGLLPVFEAKGGSKRWQPKGQTAAISYTQRQQEQGNLVKNSSQPFVKEYIHVYTCNRTTTRLTYWVLLSSLKWRLIHPGFQGSVNIYPCRCFIPFTRRLNLALLGCDVNYPLVTDFTVRYWSHGPNRNS